MTTAVVSPFFDFDMINKHVPHQLKQFSLHAQNNKFSYSNNLGSPHPVSVPCTATNMPISSGPSPSLLDRKAVGSPAMGGVFHRRHSVSSTKFSQNQFLNSLKTVEHSLLISGSGSASSNKENRMRDRSFSETGERLLNKCLGPSSPTCGGSSPVNSSRYKTELCRPFEENGTCKYGDKCQFAHGVHELRSLSRHPKYKTELCRTFHTIGFCPYGPRCHFIHNAEERRGPPQQSPPGKMERPRLQHSYSFAGFSSSGGLRDSPTSVTPPPMFFPDEVPNWPSSNPFTYSSQELANLFGPSLSAGTAGAEPSSAAPPSPTGTPYFFRPMLESPQMFEAPSSPPDSLSDQEGYQSSSGSESPSLDNSRRLPIFSRLSISDE